MLKGLLALDENLASSLALRYAAGLVAILPLQLRAGHVEAPAGPGSYSHGGGRARHALEEDLRKAGRQAVERLLATERVACPFSGPPKVLVGDRDEALLEELRAGGYDLFIEGNLDAASPADLLGRLSSRLYAKTPCPIMMVKDLVPGRQAVLLCNDSTHLMDFILRALHILAGGKFSLDLLFYRYAEAEPPEFLDNLAAGAILREAEELLVANGLRVESARVVYGTPAAVARLLTRYAVVVSPFPTRKSPRLQLLALCTSPVLFCR